ncbi:GNAT family N-acetyltransferase [Auraticoccus monumenti]|uniref:Aminoglycoside 6'-N-acetyltransferase n=1 Tax=Auraticoccus monumenti TaxID=675864 RepID=A0A1G6VF85_9ACTN|nr:GNAT family protein [Auraticoccus monumenti]SDD52168.1 aminoglycoside 6'-N-acetyltransferase [Auraticoccus monumenti]
MPDGPRPGVAPPELPLRTGRLVLRRYEEGDVDAVWAYYRDEEVNRYLLTVPFTRGYTETVVAQRRESVVPGQPGRTLPLVVEHEGQVVGDVVLTLDERCGKAELGWVFAPAAGGRGLATEATRALVDVAFDHYGVHRVLAQADARNTASARLALRLGMRQEAHLRQDWWSKGEWTDTLVFGLLRDER